MEADVLRAVFVSRGKNNKTVITFHEDSIPCGSTKGTVIVSASRATYLDTVRWMFTLSLSKENTVPIFLKNSRGKKEKQNSTEKKT